MIITLQQKIEQLGGGYKNLNLEDYNNTITIEKVEGSEVPDNQVGAINPDGQVFVITEWNHATLSKPTQEQIDAV